MPYKRARRGSIRKRRRVRSRVVGRRRSTRRVRGRSGIRKRQNLRGLSSLDFRRINRFRIPGRVAMSSGLRRPVVVPDLPVHGPPKRPLNWVDYIEPVWPVALELADQLIKRRRGFYKGG